MLTAPAQHPQDLAHALRTKLDQSRRFEVPRRPQHAFVIDHYAGKVCYATDALLDKNKDFVVAEQTALLTASSLPIIAAMFEPPKEREAVAGAGRVFIVIFVCECKSPGRLNLWSCVVLCMSFLCFASCLC